MSAALTLTFHGAAGTVTGSCMELRLADRAILVDCGLFQGSRTLETLNRGAFSFDPGKIDAVVLTHAHIDHCGLLPKLAAQGFDKPVWCTPATSDLIEYMLADAGRIQESEADRRNRRRDRAGESLFKPLYTEEDALNAWRLTRPTPLCNWFDPAPGFRARFWNAGHILGCNRKARRRRSAIWLTPISSAPSPCNRPRRCISAMSWTARPPPSSQTTSPACASGRQISAPASRRNGTPSRPNLATAAEAPC